MNTPDQAEDGRFERMLANAEDFFMRPQSTPRDARLAAVSSRADSLRPRRAMASAPMGNERIRRSSTSC